MNGTAGGSWQRNDGFSGECPELLQLLGFSLVSRSPIWPLHVPPSSPVLWGVQCGAGCLLKAVSSPASGGTAPTNRLLAFWGGRCFLAHCAPASLVLLVGIGLMSVCCGGEHGGYAQVHRNK